MSQTDARKKLPQQYISRKNRNGMRTVGTRERNGHVRAYWAPGECKWMDIVGPWGK